MVPNANVNDLASLKAVYRLEEYEAFASARAAVLCPNKMEVR